MDAQSHIPQPVETPKIMRETKNTIRVEFERTPFWQRFKSKFLSTFFLQNVLWYIFRLILLIGISYVILFPFFAKITGSFMGMDDFVDVTVRMIPKNWTLDTYKAIILENNYIQAFINTLFLSLSTALIQTMVCCLVGYGIAKFRFRGGKLVMIFVVLSLIIPHRTIQLSLYNQFKYFDLWGIFNAIGGAKATLDLTNTYWPLIILSATGLAFKNGLFIFMMRQFFTGVPDELEESAYVDGSGVYRTFLQIILPLSIPMMITIFLLSFSWQWTDNFYTELFFTNTKTVLMPSIVTVPQSLVTTYAGQNLFYSAIYNTCALLIMIPLVIMYLFCQRYLIQGIERSGIVG